MPNPSQNRSAPSVTPAMARMRGAIADIARTDPQLARDAAAYDLVEVQPSEAAVLSVSDGIRFDATLTETLSHGETVAMLVAALDSARFRGLRQTSTRH